MSPVFDIKEHTISASHIREYSRATSRSQVEELRLHVKQYTPRDNPNPRKGDVTIIGAHANGFPKVRIIPPPRRPKFQMLEADLKSVLGAL